MAIKHLHLVSDATGETVNSVARACLVQFRSITAIEHAWTLVRTQRQMERVIEGVRRNPGPVLYTVVNPDLRRLLSDCCRHLGVAGISVLDPVMAALASEFQEESSNRPGLQHEMDAEYFERIEAMHFTMAHDDGQLTADLDQADVVILGVSRTSKTPTCIYLANRGVKAANIPLVPGVPVPDGLLRARGPLIVGLTKDPSRLVQIRKNRMRQMTDADQDSDYTDIEAVKQEVASARRLYGKHGWSVIDVTRRSIEETAASILTMLKEHSQERAS